MYTFRIEKDSIPLIEIKIVSMVAERDSYLRDLVEKCFERVFRLIREEEKDSSEEADFEDEN